VSFRPEKLHIRCQSKASQRYAYILLCNSQYYLHQRNQTKLYFWC